MNLVSRLVYLDRDFIAGVYEEESGEAPPTQIIKSEGMNAGAKLPFFSAGVSAGESRAFHLSTQGMLRHLLPQLQTIPALTASSVGPARISSTGWMNGELSIFQVQVKSGGRRRDQSATSVLEPARYNPVTMPEDEVIASDTYFGLRNGDLKLALVTTEDYFSSGIGALTKLYATVLSETTIPVRALVRVMSSRSSFNEWVGIPLVILEEQSSE